MIPEPQRTYLLELLKALGPAANDFVIVGAQALKFLLDDARGTKDFDFILDVNQLRTHDPAIATCLENLGYRVVEEAKNFQFEKRIPGTAEIMRIEFMAPELLRRHNNFRVDVVDRIHAHACLGGDIALAESTPYQLAGLLPNGSPFTTAVRVTTAHGLVMLKLFALDDMYRNPRGDREKNRQKALTHAADLVAVITSQSSVADFKQSFENQFRGQRELADRAWGILREYFEESTSPGFLLYEEFLASQSSPSGLSRELRDEVERAHSMMLLLLVEK